MPIKSNLTGLGMQASLASSVVGGVNNTQTATGSTQATALLLPKISNHVFTTTAASTGAILPPGVGTGDGLSAGDVIRVANYGAQTLSVYPPTGGKIQNGSANAAFSVAANKVAEFVCIDSTNFFAILSA